MASCHNSLGGYGILPYPLRPLNILKGAAVSAAPTEIVSPSSHRFHGSLVA